MSNAHTHHREATGYPYLNIRNAEFPWGSGDLIGTK